MLKVVKQAHEADPTPETEEALREALSCELTAAMIAEDCSWRNVGVNGAAETKKLRLRSEQLLADRKEQIEAVRARIPELVQNHLLGGGTDVPLLPASSQINTASEVVLSTDPQAVAIQIRTATDTALAKFEEKAGELIAAAERRVNVTDQLIQLTSWQYLGSESPKYPKLIVLMMIKDKVVMGVDCSLNDGAIDLSPIGDFDGIKRQDLLSDTFAATCRSLNEQLEANIAVVEHYSDVAIEFEITHVVDSHFATFLHSEPEPDIEN